jgi:DNA repair exonuclease SbcCD ATPase subunit
MRKNKKQSTTLLQQIEKLKKQAIKSLVEEYHASRDQLVHLGYSFHDDTSTVKPAKDTKTKPAKPCPVCGKRGHDARRHRWEKVKAGKAAKSTPSKRNRLQRTRKEEKGICTLRNSESLGGCELAL